MIICNFILWLKIEKKTTTIKPTQNPGLTGDVHVNNTPQPPATLGALVWGYNHDDVTDLDLSQDPHILGNKETGSLTPQHDLHHALFIWNKPRPDPSALFRWAQTTQGTVSLRLLSSPSGGQTALTVDDETQLHEFPNSHLGPSSVKRVLPLTLHHDRTNSTL